MVALENVFLRTPEGRIYSTTVCNYEFWHRYLQVFEEVVVLARIKETAESVADISRADGPRVRFLSLPDFQGPWQFLRCYRKSVKTLRHAVEEADAFILRVSGTVATLLFRQLHKRELPFAVEVVGDPWDALAPGGVKNTLRPVLRYILRLNMAKQCRLAMAAAYVSERTIQRRYPPGGWSTHYSSIDLPNEAIIDDDQLAGRKALLRTLAEEDRPLRICHVGSMSALYKAQDTLIEAVSICRKGGLDVQLTFLGDGKYEGFFMTRAKEAGIAEFVNFAGRVAPGPAVMEYLDRADMFVLPSLTEGLPRSLIEALARGLPSLGSNLGGIPELLPEKYLFKPKDPKGLAARIMALTGNVDELCEMAVRNRDKAREYRYSELQARRIEFYRKVAEKTEELRG